MSHHFSFSGYKTKCDIKFLLRQLITSQTLRFVFNHPLRQWLIGKKRGEDGNTNNLISQE